jgi:hypothetical protein
MSELPHEPPAGGRVSLPELSHPLRDLARLLGRAIARRHLESRAVNAGATERKTASSAIASSDTKPSKENPCSRDSET